MHSVTDRRTDRHTDRQTDRQTDGQQAAANSRSYCVAVRSAKNPSSIFLCTYSRNNLASSQSSVNLQPVLQHGISPFRLTVEVRCMFSCDICCLKQKWTFLPRDTLVQSAVLRLHVVCSSVCLSVTLVDQDHISFKSWKLIAHTISPTSSLFVA